MIPSFTRIGIIAAAMAVGIAIAAPVEGAGGLDKRERVLFRISDVRGDDHGAGSVRYPLDEVFHPYQGYLDIHKFEVSADSDSVYFRFHMGAVSAEPFNPPEGFFHQRIDLFIHTGDEGGRTAPLRAGSGVVFSQRHPWHMWVKVAPFGGTALYTWLDSADSPGRRSGITATGLKESGVIEVRIPVDTISPPTSKWRYYVLVGSFDGLGDDEYRAVAPERSRWLLGGDAPDLPGVVDVIAPGWGPRRQSVQLAGGKDPPVLFPVGGFDPFNIRPSILIGLAALVFAIAAALIAKVRQFFPAR